MHTQLDQSELVLSENITMATHTAITATRQMRRCDAPPPPRLWRSGGNGNQASPNLQTVGPLSKHYPIDFVLSFDIEKTGESPQENSMVALGGCIVSVSNSIVLERFVVFMKLEEGHCFDPLCKREYWDNWIKFPMNKKVLWHILEEGVSPREGIRQFAEWLDKWERYFEEHTSMKLALAVDTVGSDTMWVSHYFQKYLTTSDGKPRPPIEDQYGEQGRYRPIRHSNAFAQGLAQSDFSKGFDWRQELRNMGVQLPPDDMHNHMPDSDAEYIAKTFAACVRWTHDRRMLAGSSST